MQSKALLLCLLRNHVPLLYMVPMRQLGMLRLLGVLRLLGLLQLSRWLLCTLHRMQKALLLLLYWQVVRRRLLPRHLLMG